MAAQHAPATEKRPRGRPRLDIDPDAVADAVAELCAEGGLDAVSILDTAEKLSVSRATLYRSVPTKEHLVGMLLERSAAELTASVKKALKETDEPGDRLIALLGLQIDAAISMRHYMPLFFGQESVPPDVYKRWRKWIRDFERIWVDVIEENMEAGLLRDANPVITARLLLGSCQWVSRWYRPDDKYTDEMIRDTAVGLIKVLQGRGHAPQQAASTGKAPSSVERTVGPAKKPGGAQTRAKPKRASS